VGIDKTRKHEPALACKRRAALCVSISDSPVYHEQVFILPFGEEPARVLKEKVHKFSEKRVGAGKEVQRKAAKRARCEE